MPIFEALVANEMLINPDQTPHLLQQVDGESRRNFGKGRKIWSCEGRRDCNNKYNSKKRNFKARGSD